MAIGTSFKQQCPSCEALVPVKDASMVGKKIECPKCKDKFVVKSPSKKKSADDEDEDGKPPMGNPMPRRLGQETGKRGPASCRARRPKKRMTTRKLMRKR